jgi:alkyl sulfatase BDS1-like metallo-beta-lactamase superfamily hydrolase
MNFCFPEQGWLCMAENCSHNMHNLVPVRGAQVRDALRWSKYIDEADRLFGADTTVMFTSHHWPRWGSDDVRGFLRMQRDMYRYIHDQTMRHANHGLTATEIAEIVALPDEYRSEAHTTGYYGHIAHNVKAVYQRYLSWYDGNPANLWKLPPVDAGSRYVALAGGSAALLDHARASFEAGDYRWVAEVVNHLVFADPANVEARELQADAFEQLGYQSESATFRNAYLCGANELRYGHPPRHDAMKRGLLAAMTIEQLLDAVAVRLRAEEVGGLSATVHLRFGGEAPFGGDWTVGLSNRSLSCVTGLHGDADAVARLRRDVLLDLSTNSTDVTSALDAGRIEVDGDAAVLEAVFGHLDTFQSMFPIVEP